MSASATVIGLKSSNVKRLSAIEITPSPTGTVVIGGKNGQGKSSVLDSILYALGGGRSIPGKPVHNGQQDAEIVVELSTDPPMVVRRKIKADGKSSLEIRQKIGDIEAKVSSPQKVLDTLVGAVAFDPLAFTRLSNQKQIEVLKQVVGVETADLDLQIDHQMEVRKGQKAELTSMESWLEDMEHYDTLPGDIDPNELLVLTEKLEQAEAKVEQRDRIDMQISYAERDLNEVDQDIQKLEHLLKEALDKKSHLQESLTGLKAKMEECESVDTTELKNKIDAINRYNSMVKANKAYDEKRSQVELKAKSIEQATADIETLRNEKVKRLDSANWPVEGLGFTADGVTVNDLPFEQCSSAEQLKISTAIGLAQNPRLKVMFIRDGSLLDSESLEFVRQLAEEHGAQIWVERVSDGEECSIVIEDGAVREPVTA